VICTCMHEKVDDDDDDDDCPIFYKSSRQDAGCTRTSHPSPPASSELLALA
jgi:hypothetical protein